MGWFRTLLHIYFGREYVLIRNWDNIYVKHVKKIGWNYYVRWDMFTQPQLLPKGRTNSVCKSWEPLTTWGEKHYNSKKTDLEKNLDETKTLLDSI